MRVLDDCTDTPHMLDALPASELTLEGRRYMIHGIPHGRSDGGGLSRQFYSYVNAEVRKFTGKHDGQDYICEQGFTSLFGLPKEGQMTDVLHDQISPWMYDAMACNLLLTVYQTAWSVLVKRTRGKRLCELREISNDVLTTIARAWDEAAKSPHFLPRFRYVYTCFLDMPAWQRYMIDGTTYGRIAYSKRMAAHARGFAENRGLDTLHVIVGLYHEPQIQHFLQHPHQSPSEFLLGVYW